MARLNDPPPPPIESVEALKRRFTRQNRDFARINTSQAVRIRNLEAETVRLLRENLSLREDLIASKEECLRLKTTTESLDVEILQYRDELQARLADLSSHIDELTRLPDQVRQKEQNARRQTQVKTEPSSPTKEAWRNRQQNPPSLQDQDNMLPPIVEGKAFPRLTLDLADFANARDDDQPEPLDSPEIGPPPTTQFSELDESPMAATDPVSDTATVEPQPLLHNIEKRRKRRTSSLIADMESGNDTVEATEPNSQIDPIKRSVKRKLNASELDQENRPQPGMVKQSDDFVYQRRPALKASSTARKSSRFARPSDRPALDVASSQNTSPQKGRTALAPLNTNSPSKRSVESKESVKPADQSRDLQREKGSVIKDRRKRQSLLEDDLQIPANRKPAETSQVRGESATVSEKVVQPTTDLEHPPKTPFLHGDLLSPSSSQPSGPQMGRVKQEAVIMNSVEDVLNGSIGRGSRRAKAAVSYAEPSLRDKMRRPGKELVGAVEGYDRRNRDGSLVSDKGRASTEDVGSLKPYKHSNLSNSEEPGSPLHEKQAANEKRKRETIDIQRWAAGERQESTNTSGSQRRKSDIVNLEASLSGLSIFDPPKSSPRTSLEDSSTTHTQPPTAPPPEKKPSTSGRITSSASASSTRRHSLQPTSRSDNSSISRRVSLATSTARPSSAASRRSKSAVDLQSDAAVALARSASTSHLAHRRRASSATTHSSSPTSEVEDISDYEPTNLSIAAENIESGSMRATRRKSMVV